MVVHMVDREQVGKVRDQGKELGSFLGQTCRVVRFGFVPGL